MKIKMSKEREEEKDQEMEKLERKNNLIDLPFHRFVTRICLLSKYMC